MWNKPSWKLQFYPHLYSLPHAYHFWLPPCYFQPPGFLHKQQSNWKSHTTLTGDFYIYTTYNTYQGNRIPANGMYLVTGAGVVLFDTPWDNTQFQPLLDSIQLKASEKSNHLYCHTLAQRPYRRACLLQNKGNQNLHNCINRWADAKEQQKRANFY